MADEPRDEDVETLELTEEADEQAETDKGGDEESPEDDGDEEEVVVSFDGEDATADQPNDSSVIRQLRQELKEARRQAQEAQRASSAKPKIEIGDKPTLEGCDYDQEVFEREYEGWRQRKEQAEAETQQEQAQAEEAQRAWQGDLQAYQAKKQALAIPDFDDAEELVTGKLSQVQQAVLVKAAADPAAMIYALSRNPGKLDEFARVKDPIKLAAMVARMEGKVQVVKRKKAPALDRAATGTATTLPNADKELEKLEKEAGRTGDRTKLIRYKASLKAKGKAA